jgi:hypothetical protein
MAESLEDYLRRLLQQAQAPPKIERRPPRRPRPPVVEAEMVETELEPSSSADKGDALPAPRSSPGLTAPQSDERLASHVHEAFDRSLGELGAPLVESKGAPAAKSLAEELADLLRSPEGIRKAFVVSEILQRPEHRW